MSTQPESEEAKDLDPKKDAVGGKHHHRASHAGDREGDMGRGNQPGHPLP